MVVEWLENVNSAPGGDHLIGSARVRAQADLIDHIGDTPLVPLRRVGAGLPVPVLAKCEHLNPGGCVKDRIARAIVDDAEARGVLKPGHDARRGDRRQHRRWAWRWWRRRAATSSCA